MKLPLFVATLAGLLALPFAAGAVTYDCKLKADTRLGWIPSQLIIIIGTDENRALVYDGFIAESHGEPIPAGISRTNDQKFKLTWEVLHMKIDNRRNTISGNFVANLNTATGAITMQVFLKGADILPRGRGKCEVKS